MNDLQKFLLEDGFLLSHSQTKFDYLKNELGVKAVRHPKFNNLVLFVYDQIGSPKMNPIVRNARGIILDENNNWEAVCRPFDKFYNWGEGDTVETFDWNTATVYEKLDGSLLNLWWYDGEWMVSTKGHPSADGNVHGFNFKFSELFWKVFQELKYVLPYVSYRNCTFMFELMTPYNRVVVPHKENKLVLLGVRNNATEEEYLPQSFAGLDWAFVKYFSLVSLDDCSKFLQNVSGLEQEGFVAVDYKFNRIKLKNPAYVALHRLKDGLCPRRLLELIRLNEVDEFLTYFPEYKEITQNIKAKYDNFVEEMQKKYNEIQHIENRKEFASFAVKTKCPSCLFSLKDIPFSDAREFFSKFNIKHLMNLIGLKDEQSNSGE